MSPICVYQSGKPDSDPQNPAFIQMVVPDKGFQGLSYTLEIQIRGLKGQPVASESNNGSGQIQSGDSNMIPGNVNPKSDPRIPDQGIGGGPPVLP